MFRRREKHTTKFETTHILTQFVSLDVRNNDNALVAYEGPSGRLVRRIGNQSVQDYHYSRWDNEDRP